MRPDLLLYRHLGCKITWNVGNMSNSRLLLELMRIITDHRPVALHLQEVFDRQEVLEEVARRTGYTLVAPKGGAAHCSSLLSPEATEVGGAKTMLLSERTWVGRRVAGARKSGFARKNDAVFVRYTWRKERWIDNNVHLVPSHHIAAACKVAKRQVRVLNLWFRTRFRIVHVVGDLNETINEPCDSLAPMERGTGWYTGRTHGKRGIDYIFWLKRQTKRLVYVGEVLLGFSSDHNPVKVDIYRRRPGT